MNPAEPPTDDTPKNPAQFSLGGMLWFMAACSAYFAAIKVAPSILLQGPTPRDSATLVVSWLITGAFIFRKGEWGMLITHCICPVTGLVFGPQEAEHLAGVVILGCLASTFLTFPASVLVALATGLAKLWRK